MRTLLVAFLALAACSKSKPATTTPTAPVETGGDGPAAPPPPPDDAPTEERPPIVADDANPPPTDPIYFEFDSSTISPQGRDLLAAYAELINKTPSVAIRVEGHTDDEGTDEYNLALGERRAQAVRDYLIRLGVPAARLSILTYGEARPQSEGTDDTSRAKNRRAHLVIAS